MSRGQRVKGVSQSNKDRTLGVGGGRCSNLIYQNLKCVLAPTGEKNNP